MNLVRPVAQSVAQFGSVVKHDYIDSCSEKVSNFFVFFWRFLCHPREVGTPFACSAAVGREITSLIPDPSDQPHFYLEGGAGNGDLTKHFVKKLGSKDRLDLVEIDEVFCRELRRLYGNDSRIHVHNMPIQDWKPTYKYDAVVVSIPLNALPTPDILRKVLDAYVDLTKEGGILSGVEYIGTSTLKGWTVFGEKSRAFQQVVKMKKDFFDTYCFDKVKVWQNLPPARVMHCKISK